MRGLSTSADSKFRSLDVRWSEVRTQQLLEYFQNEQTSPQAGLSPEYVAGHVEWLRGAIDEIKRRIGEMEDERVRSKEFSALALEVQNQTPLDKRPLGQQFIEESSASLRVALRNAELELKTLTKT